MLIYTLITPIILFIYMVKILPFLSIRIIIPFKAMLMTILNLWSSLPCFTALKILRMLTVNNHIILVIGLGLRLNDRLMTDITLNYYLSTGYWLICIFYWEFFRTHLLISYVLLLICTFLFWFCHLRSSVLF